MVKRLNSLEDYFVEELSVRMLSQLLRGQGEKSLTSRSSCIYSGVVFSRLSKYGDFHKTEQ